MADDISKQIEEASKPLKPAFKEIVDSLAENNKEIACFQQLTLEILQEILSRVHSHKQR